MLLICTVRCCGGVPFGWPKKLKVVGLTANCAAPPPVPPVTISVTGKRSVLFAAPVPLTRMVAEYTPAARPTGFSETVMAAGVLLLFVDTVRRPDSESVVTVIGTCTPLVVDKVMTRCGNAAPPGT